VVDVDVTTEVEITADVITADVITEVEIIVETIENLEKITKRIKYSYYKTSVNPK
jgi:hypothetical protein